MKGNIVKEMRKVVKSLYEEGHEEIFGFTILEDGEDVKIQVSDFSLEPVYLDRKYEKTYKQALNTFKLAKSRYGSKCKALNSLICDEVSEEVFLDGNVLMILYLNVL